MTFALKRPFLFTMLPWLLLPLLSPTALADGDKDELTFKADVLPIFRAKCIRCHAGVEPKSGLNLTSPSSLLTGGDSGAALRIGAAEFSLLYEKVSGGEMPPVGQKLTAEEKGVIRKWINSGAEGVSNAKILDESDDVTSSEHWSFQPPKRPEVPTATPQNRIRNPIDAFVLKQLQEEGLTFAKDADRLTLLRRATFDLTGLPPTPAEVGVFVNNDANNAFDDMVEQRLVGKHYGARWGRHWLDITGFADSAGILNEDRPLQLTWRYRDYVVQAFNSDKPYDRFLQEQIAGDELTDYWAAFETMDELPDDVTEGIIATGYLRTAADASRPDFATIKNAAAQYYYPTLFDTLQIVCSSTMGLTVQCARCHSHKFDPVPQTDYYRMQAVFMSAYRPGEWIPQMNRRLHIATKKQKTFATERNAEVDANTKTLKAELTTVKAKYAKQLFEDRLGKLPSTVQADVRAAFTVKAETRSEAQKQLTKKHEKQLKPTGKDLDAALAEFSDFKTKADEINGRISQESDRRQTFAEVRALYDLPGEVETPVLLRGDPLTPGPNVEPGVISSLVTPEPFDWKPPAADAKTSGRRLAFAKWLTQPGHPLTARVMVNRIWMHHFGTGLVSTPDDFGISGTPPSHPELLDWLATEFVNSGWSVKHMHRLIMTSTTWRQQSRVDEAHRKTCEAVDPNNHLLWRQSMRRLEAEALRDSLLAVSGTLNETHFGGPMAVARQKDGEVIVHNAADQNRRSVYMQTLRLNPETMLQAFDQPAMSVNCMQRSTSTVSTQALTLLNSDMMIRCAAAFADRMLKEEPEAPIPHAVLTAFARPAADAETKVLSTFFDRQAAQYLSEQDESKRNDPDVITATQTHAMTDLCHMLMTANEFVYVD